METPTARTTAHSGTVEGSLGKKMLMSTLMTYAQRHADDSARAGEDDGLG